MQPSRPKRNFRLWYSVTGGLVAASIALLIVFNLLPHHPRNNFEDVEKAFANLSSSDQDYLFATYQKRFVYERIKKQTDMKNMIKILVLAVA